MKKTEKKPQLFILADEIWENSSVAEIDATRDDMIEMDIYYPPCDYFNVIINGKFMPYAGAKECGYTYTEEEMEYYNNNHFIIEYDIPDMSDWMNTVSGEILAKKKDGNWQGAFYYNNLQFLTGNITKAQYDEFKEATENTVVHILSILIVALATKNVERKPKPNKIAKQIISASRLKKDYEYTTTLTIGKVIGAERDEGQVGGWKVRPHLRRGHIREQRFGPNNQYSKKVFIQPIFVNAAEGVIDTRKAYNVRKPNILWGSVNGTN